ncbi:MAG: hypothetical protein ACT4TC_04455 [Myxococcaceae bacterium]
MRCPFGALCHASGKALTPAQRERLCRWGDELIKAAPEQNFASSCRGRQMWPVALPVGQCVIAMESSEEPITEYKRWVRAFAVDPCGSPAPP